MTQDTLESISNCAMQSLIDWLVAIAFGVALGATIFFNL